MRVAREVDAARDYTVNHSCSFHRGTIPPTPGALPRVADMTTLVRGRAAAAGAAGRVFVQRTHGDGSGATCDAPEALEKGLEKWREGCPATQP